ncbi:MAG: class II glutamine amidotransferase [Phycisphaerales bacterium]|nr:class II glutamine amidotransferase [Phycisphaerales bacterium]
MCRWLAYSGAPILLEDILFKPAHSLIDQSMSSKSAETPTNGDGFGVGWYDDRATPGLFRSIRPAWNDFNLRDLAAHIESPRFLAHVRATSQAVVQETNCHPFRHKNWLFVHNGEVFGIEKFRKRLVHAVAEELFPEMMGTTDSEVMFYLAITFGLERDPAGALARMAGFIETTANESGIEESLWMTLGVSDGKVVHAVRYASDGQAPTLYHSRDVDDAVRWNPQLAGRFAPDTRFIVSEPAGTAVNVWVEVPQGSYVRVEGESLEIRPFVPVTIGRSA